MSAIFLTLGGAICFVFQCLWWCFTAVFYCVFMSISAIAVAIYICIKALLWCLGQACKHIVLLCIRICKFCAIANIRTAEFSVILVYVAIRCFLFIFIPLTFRAIFAGLGWMCEVVWVSVYSIGLAVCIAVSILCFSMNAMVGGSCSVLTMLMTLCCELVVGCFQFVTGLLGGVVGWMCCVITNCVDGTCSCLKTLGAPPPDSINPIPEEVTPDPSGFPLVKPLPKPSRSSTTAITASAVPGPMPTPPTPVPCLLPPPLKNVPSPWCKAKGRLKGPRGSLSLDVVGSPPLAPGCGAPPQRLVKSAQEQRCSRLNRQPEPPAEPKPLPPPPPQGPEYIKIRPVPKPSGKPRKMRRLRRTCDWEAAHDCDVDCRKK